MTYSRLIACGLAAALFASAAAAQTPAPGSLRAACAADFQKACPDAKPGPGGGYGQCARAHFTEFSSPCQSAIQAMRARMQANQAAKAAAAPAAGAPATNSP